MDEILDDEENVFAGAKPFGNISEIGHDGGNEPAATYNRMSTEESTDTTFSIGQLARMTTIRRVFEEFKVDISKLRFADLYEMITDTRDFSEESLKKLWKNTFNPELRADQTLVQRTKISVEDSYGLIEEDDNCLVFDSKESAESEKNKMTIQ